MQKCQHCGKEVVHDERIYATCLDCAVEQINKLGMRLAKLEEKLKDFDQEVQDVAINNLEKRLITIEHKLK